MKRSLALLALVLLGGAFSLVPLLRTPPLVPPPVSPGGNSLSPPVTVPAEETSSASLSHVGRARCAECHPTEHAAWIGSHHDLAMAEPTSATSKGDFSGVTFTHGDEVSEYITRDGQPMVRVTRNGTSRTYPVRYTFGITPLQQVLLETERGRLQAHTNCFATEEAQGGARWFALDPDRTPPSDDPFHWKGISFNWNYMCSECHSTAVTKGYDRATDTYSTTWEEIDVSCEACHGPGSTHVAWAEDPDADRWPTIGPARGFPLRLRRDPAARWVRGEGETTAHREPAIPERPELDACGRCHSRRTALADTIVPGKSLHDTHRVAFLSEGLYFPDGQILDEVYVYGSFLQSRMHAAGVTCSDCHNAHTGTLHLEGNLLCAGCHDPETFDVEGHTHHAAPGPGSACVDCHMVARSYMGVDPRRDHSFRIPRPDLSTRIDVPNACTECHAEMSDDWAAEKMRSWFPEGVSGKPHFAEALVAARSGSRDGAAALAAVAENPEYPAIVRATAFSELGGRIDRSTLGIVIAGLAAEDPLIRRGALLAAEGLPPELLGPIAAEHIADPILSVRLEATRLLAPLHDGITDRVLRGKVVAAIEEYRAVQVLHSDRPEGRTNLGLLSLALGNTERAETEFVSALALEPTFGAAAVQLSDLYRALGRDVEGVTVLRTTLGHSPDDPGVHHALGLALVRLGETIPAIASLRRAADLAPQNSRYTFVLAVALRDTGSPAEALQVLDRALLLRPHDASLADLRRQYSAGVREE